MFENFYNHDIAILFIGGVCAWFLAATIDTIKNVQGSNEDGRNPGDKKTDRITAVLPDIRKALVDSGIQPLLIVTFVNLLDDPNELNVIGVFSLVIFIMFHAFHLSDKYSGKLFYQLIILSIWGIYFFFISYSANLL